MGRDGKIVAASTLIEGNTIILHRIMFECRISSRTDCFLVALTSGSVFIDGISVWIMQHSRLSLPVEGTQVVVDSKVQGHAALTLPVPPPAR